MGAQQIPGMGYRDLDAFKICHELTLAIHRSLDALKERDPEMAAQLWHAALITTTRIARGSVFSNRQRFAFWLNCSLGALLEIDYCLSLADGLNLIEREAYQQLEGLRARAAFYVTKLLFSLVEPPPP